MSIVTIAKLAGVSHSTVSRVINSRPGVSKETVDKIEKIMERNDFVPRPRNSRPGPKAGDSKGLNTGLVVLLYCGISKETTLMSPATILLSRGVEAALSNFGMSMIVAYVDEETRVPPSLANGKIDGVILVGSDPPGNLRKILKNYTIVGVFSNLQDFWGDCIHVDNEAMGDIAAGYFLERGKKRLAFIDGYPKTRSNQIKCEQFKKAVTELGGSVEIIVPASGSASGDDDYYCNLEPLIERMVKLSPIPDGIYVPNAVLVAQLYEKLAQRGLVAGKDVIVLTTNVETTLLRKLDPHPAIIDCKPDYIGKRAVEQLLWRINRTDDPQQTILVKPEIMIC